LLAVFFYYFLFTTFIRNGIINHMKSIKKLFFLLCIIISFVLPLSAKESIGIIIQLGALGSEKTYYSSSTLSNETISLPYTKITFNPNIHIGINIPVSDISEKCFFAFDSYFNTYASYERVSYTFFHKFSLIPVLTFIKSNLHFFAGTGFSFGIEPYKYEFTTNTSKYTDEYNNFKIFWTSKLGIKYRLGKHFFTIADITTFVTLFDTYNHNDYNSKISGDSTLEFLPKFGFMYQF